MKSILKHNGCSKILSLYVNLFSCYGYQNTECRYSSRGVATVFGGCGERPDKMVRSVTGYKDLESTLKRLQLAGGNSRDVRIALLIGHKV